MSDFPRRYYLIVRDADKATAAARYASIDPDTGGARTFDFVPLARTTAPTVTVAWGCETAATLDMVAKFGQHAQDLQDQGKLAIYRLDNGAFTVASALADTTKKTHALVRKQEV